MTDFDYDVMQKKRIARGAFHKVNGSKSKGCRLPYENLTKKEREALNGEIKTVSMMRPIAWEPFKGLASDLQEEYLDTQIRRFDVGLTTIGRELFGLAGEKTLANYVRDHELTVISAPPGRQPKAAREIWQRWLRSETITAPDSEDTYRDETQYTHCEPAPSPTDGDQNSVKPFRAHDFEDMFKEMGMERELTATLPKEEEDSENVSLYPLTDLSLTLKGTPIDILTTLRMSFPALLDKDTQYRFTIKVDTFVL